MVKRGIQKAKKSGLYFKLVFIATGIASTIWFVIRVIPKPSRAAYPCMKVAAPWASAFVLYLLSLTSSVMGWRRAKEQFLKARYLSAGLVVLLTIMVSATAILLNNSTIKAAFRTYPEAGETITEEPNSPMGEAKGIFPGRVVWSHDPDATNENCDPDDFGHTWYHDENNNQRVIDTMLSHSLWALTGTKSDKDAWDSIFMFHNKTRGKGRVNYESGEIIFIKTNATSTFGSNYRESDLADVDNKNYGIAETSPQLVLSVLRQLVNVVGVEQGDIYVGDPMKHIYKTLFEKWHAEFPNIHYLDHDGFAGREQVTNSQKASIFYSDRGTILRTGEWSDATAGDPVEMDYLYDILADAEYMLNIPTLKAHRRAGVTMFAKNHFGSHTRINAKHLHGGLVAPEGGDAWRSGYGLYRVTVDIMGHEVLGKKNLLYIMDALFTAEHEVTQPTKWFISPFNGDWMSSVFVSFDPVAIESVGYDFLKAEYTGEHGRGDWVQMNGTDDYLHQAADPANWPDNIQYDPENDGTILSSLGVHEHWNSVDEKKYSRNLGMDNGIELLDVRDYIQNPTGIESIVNETSSEINMEVFPNPANEYITIQLHNGLSGAGRIKIYDLSGELIQEIGFIKQHRKFRESLAVGYLEKGLYIIAIEIDGETQTKQVIVN